jgi:hypothetical protein
LKITYVYLPSQDDQTQVLWRCANYAQAIDRVSLHQAGLLDMRSFVKNTKAAQQECSSSDIIVIHRYFFGSVLLAVQKWKTRNIKIVLDMDEALDLVQPAMPQYAMWREGRQFSSEMMEVQDDEQVIHPAPLAQLQWGLRLVDAVTVPSERLADDWERSAPAFHLPDYLDLTRYLHTPKPRHESIHIGVCGDGNTLWRLRESGLLAALERVCARRPNVKIWLNGMDSDSLENIQISREQLEVHPFVSNDDWPAYLANFDIGLAPLHGPYDLRKSRQNVLEFMATKIPWIASNHLPYRDLGRYGWLITNQVEAWERSMLEMMDNLESYRAEAAGDAFVYALGQNIDEHIDTALRVYSSILAPVQKERIGI